MADDWSVELAIKEVFYQLIDDFLFPRIDDFSFRTIKAGVHFRIFFAERKIFNFAPALLLKTLFLFLVLDFFPFWSWKKNQLQSGVNYSIANETAECNKLLNKTKTVKHRCEKSKCRVAMCLKKNSWSSSYSSLTKTWNSPFECLYMKICHTHNPFLLIFLCLKFKRSNSQSISFLSKLFGTAF